MDEKKGGGRGEETSRRRGRRMEVEEEQEVLLTSRACMERKSVLELKCFCRTSWTDLSSHRTYKRRR